MTGIWLDFEVAYILGRSGLKIIINSTTGIKPKYKLLSSQEISAI